MHMQMHRYGVCCALVVAAGSTTALGGFDPWADTVVSYDPGTEDVNTDFIDPDSALGEPSRFTGDNAVFSGFDSAVTPFNGAFNVDQIVTLGGGGSLTLGFDEPVTDDAANPFGIDLLIFGNASILDTDFPNGQAGDPATITSEGGIVELSSDGENWIRATGVTADGPFPTLGYSDLTDPFSPTAGDVETDFTQPVDPDFSLDGQSFAEIVAGYNGAGGGTGIDIAAFGLSEVSFVRITNPLGSGVTPEIDAVVDVAVPTPGATALALTGLAFATRRRRH